MKLNIIRGLPGSGKSTFAKKNFPTVLHIENDMFFTANGQYTYNADKLPKVIAASQQAVELAMQVGADCVFCGVMPLAEHVDSFANIGKKYNAEVVVYCLKKQYESAHAIPLNIIETMMQKWQNYKGEIDS